MLQLIDTLHLGRPLAIMAGLEGTDRLALLDCGPDPVFRNVVSGIRARGLRPENVSHVLVTHIHLDHAGGAWRWAAEFGSTVCVHPRGAAHLLDPSRLVSSATKVFGADMERLWGEIQAIPSDRLRVVTDGEWIEAGSAGFQAIETPGHATHHHAYWLAAEETVYGGDVTGVSIAGGPCQPPCPPPDVDIESWKKSLARIRALRAKRIIAVHGGELKDPVSALAELEANLDEWAAWVLDGLCAGKSEEAMAPEFEQKVWADLRGAGVTEDILATYEHGNPAAKSVYGLARYWRKFHPDRLEGISPGG